MAAGLPAQYFTALNISSVTIATMAIIVVTNTLYTLFRVSPKWTAIVMGLLIAYLNVIIMQAPQWYDWLLAFVNGCLLFCSALGLNEIAVSSKKPEEKGAIRPSGFFRSWM